MCVVCSRSRVSWCLSTFPHDSKIIFMASKWKTNACWMKNEWPDQCSHSLLFIISICETCFSCSIHCPTEFRANIWTFFGSAPIILPVKYICLGYIALRGSAHSTHTLAHTQQLARNAYTLFVRRKSTMAVHTLKMGYKSTSVKDYTHNLSVKWYHHVYRVL